MPAPAIRTAPDMLSGARGYEQLNSARVVVDMEDEILMYQPNATPLLTLTGKIGQKRKADNPQFQFLEKDELPRRVIASAVMTDVGTTLQVGTNEHLRLASGQLILNLQTREVMRVGVVTSATNIAVTRGIGGGNQTVAIGDVFVHFTNAKEDGDTSGTSKSVKEFNDYNYTQIIETPFDFTGRDLVVSLYGGPDETVETKWQGIEHKKSIELAMFFGRRHTMTGTTHLVTMMGGLEYFITTNRANVSAQALNERWFIEYLEYAMRYGKGGKRNGVGKKYFLCSSRWLTEINLWVKDRLEYRTMDSQIGFAAYEYKSPHGIVYIVPTPILDDDHPDWGFLLDFNHLKYVYLNKRDTKILVDVQAGDLDGKKNLYRSDVGIQVNMEHAHGIITGISI